MNLQYSIDVGYGIRIKKHEAEATRPDGYVVEIHFYKKEEAVKYAAQFIQEAATR